MQVSDMICVSLHLINITFKLNLTAFFNCQARIGAYAFDFKSVFDLLFKVDLYSYWHHILVGLHFF